MTSAKNPQSRDFNVPLVGAQICDPKTGCLTPEAMTFLRRLWERTGHAPGTDISFAARRARDAADISDMASIMLMLENASLRGQLAAMAEKLSVVMAENENLSIMLITRHLV